MRVLVIGKAKTGTTALVSLVKQTLDPCDLVMEPRSVLDFAQRSIDRDTGRSRERDKAAAPADKAPQPANEAIKILWEHFTSRPNHLRALVHGEFGFPVDKVVFVTRDARDEMVSKLLYHAKIAKDDRLTPDPAKAIKKWVKALEAKQQAPQKISFRDLTRTFERIYQVDLWPRLTAITEKRDFERYIKNPGRDAHVIQYEDLIAGRTDSLADYLGVPITTTTESVDLGKYGYTKRSAKAEAWRSFFTGEDVEILRPLLSQLLPGKRYKDWRLDPKPVIEAAEVSEYVARIGAPSPGAA